MMSRRNWFAIAALMSTAGAACAAPPPPSATFDKVPLDTAIVDISAACLIVCTDPLPKRVVLYRDGRAVIDDSTSRSGMSIRNVGHQSTLAMAEEAVSAIAAKPQIDTEASITDGIAVKVKVVTNHDRFDETVDNPDPRGWPEIGELLDALHRRVSSAPGGTPYLGAAVAYVSQSLSPHGERWPFLDQLSPRKIMFQASSSSPGSAPGCISVPPAQTPRYREDIVVSTGLSRPYPESVSMIVYPQLPGETCSGAPGATRKAGQWGNSTKLAPERAWARLGEAEEVKPIDELVAWTALRDAHAVVENSIEPTEYRVDEAYRAVRVGMTWYVDIRYQVSDGTARLVRVDPYTGTVSAPLHD